MRLLISLVVWVGAVFGAAQLSSAVASDYKTSPSSVAASASGPAAAPFDPSSVKAADRRSLFREANLARALSIARRHLGSGARIGDVTLYPGYITFPAVRSGTTGDAEIQADGSYSFQSTVAPDQTAFPLRRLG